MGKAYVGIDIGYDRLKLALVKDGRIKKAAIEKMPEHMMRDGKIVSAESMGEFIKDCLRRNRISCDRAALVLPEESMFVKNVRMPGMSVDQLKYNLPYEFADYLTDEVKNYSFDYAIDSISEVKSEDDGEENAEEKPKRKLKDKTPKVMELLGAALKTEYLDEIRLMMKKAGLKFCKAAPEIFAYSALIEKASDANKKKDCCIIDLGYHSVRMYMFSNGKYETTRTFETGLSVVAEILAETLDVDKHLAQTYLINNHDNAQNNEKCLESYDRISVEIMRALNFYRFSNPDSSLNDIYLCGGGSEISSLRTAIATTLEDYEVHSGDELLGNASLPEDAANHLLSTGITLLKDDEEKARSYRRDLPTKKSINFATVNIKSINWIEAAIWIVLIIIAAALFSKFLVADRFAKVSALNEIAMQYQAEINAYQEKIDSYGDLSDEYAHYTYTGMTDEELNRTDRVAIIDLIKTKIQPYGIVNNWNVVDNTLSISVTASDLQAINDIVFKIEEDELVQFATVVNAATNNITNEETNIVYETVTGQITVYLNSTLNFGEVAQ